MNYIGIDLAWTYNNETGICVINDKGKIVCCESEKFSDIEIATIVCDYSTRGSIVGIDAPLIVPNQEGSRSCEPALMRDTINGQRLSVFCSSRNYLENTYGVIRGEKVVTQIQQLLPTAQITTNVSGHNHAVIELFPTSICLGLFPHHYPIKYKKKKGVSLATTKPEMLRMFDALSELKNKELAVGNIEVLFEDPNVLKVMTGTEYKHLEDKVDAFLCAYASYWFKNKNGRVFGNEQEGFIMVPVENDVPSDWIPDLLGSPPIDSISIQWKPSKIATDQLSASNDLNDMVEAIRKFHLKNGYEIGSENQTTMLYRMNLMIEELGEISQCLTKGNGNIAEEHADMLILLLGNCLTMNIDIVEEFWNKYRIIMERPKKTIGQFNRVSDWKDDDIL